MQCFIRVRVCTHLVIYPTLVNTVFKMLSCRTLGLDGESVNRFDYSVDCNSGGHAFMTFLAWVFMLVYAIGIPYMYLRELWAVRAELQLPVDPEAELPAAKKKFAFLVGSYSPDCYWFEIAEFGRKFVIT